MKKNLQSVSCIIVASGQGNRFRNSLPKQFIPLKGKPILEYSLEVFQQHPQIDEIILVLNKESLDIHEKSINLKKYTKLTRIVTGGQTRQISVCNGLDACSAKAERVLVHDGVRPFVTEDLISYCLNGLTKYKAVSVAIPVSQTVFEVDEQQVVKNVPDRERLYCVQTPQGFMMNTIKKAHKMAKNEKRYDFTDDCGMIIHYGLGEVGLIEGSEKNIKITYPDDIYVAEKILGNLSI
ncbi:MAG: 2-C-methyl-D-erythritol 4-phosphate cytidylyltransferase [Candidatus Margulisbacteria bacterium]|nr:2-C-methyl-D-erythritol 4-phosphate cytidylyltransferase [Candidatus Margulisiibacteriota bacterium]